LQQTLQALRGDVAAVRGDVGFLRAEASAAHLALTEQIGAVRRAAGAVIFNINAPAPTLSSVVPSSGVPGSSVNVALTGANFTSGATVKVGNPGMTVSNVNVLSGSQMAATYTIAVRILASHRSRALRPIRWTKRRR